MYISRRAVYIQRTENDKRIRQNQGGRTMTNEQQVILQKRYKRSIGKKDELETLERDLYMIIGNETGSAEFHLSMLGKVIKELNNSE